MSGERLGNWETLLVEREDGIATVTLNRPDRLNAMNRPMRKEIGDSLLELARDDQTRVVVITGAGRAFSAGGDHADFRGATPEVIYDLMRDLVHRWLKALWNLEKPTIAAVNGVAAGGGANLAFACDIVIASDKARFGQAFVNIGLIPDCGGLFTVPREIGLHRAKELAFTGDLLEATEAKELRLINRVVPHDELMVQTMALARRLAAGPARALAMAKALLNRSFESSMDQMLQYEIQAQPLLFGTADHKEGLAAFREKRRPNFGQREDSATGLD